jgi:serine phosphatase RsbU (regulator of sigma subunit)
MTTGAPVVDGDHDGGRLPAKRYVAPIGGGFGSVEGLLVLDLSPQRAFDDGYRTFVELVAQVIGSALDSAYRRSVEVGEYRRLNDSLKAALLQPASDFATVAARYLPADGRLAIGGDWYDIIDLGDDKRALVVGDCVGHGLDAATVMAQLRSASRAMLLDDQDPASALTALDSFATTLDGAFCTTAICAVVDRRKGSITYSRAGHLPPLVVASNSVAWLDGAGGVPLGLDPSPPRYNETYELPPDSMFVLFTDGLVERPGERIDTGLERLAAAALELIGTSTVQELADGLLARMIDGDVRDDVVVVAKHLPPQRARVSD